MVLSSEYILLGPGLVREVLNAYDSWSGKRERAVEAPRTDNGPPDRVLSSLQVIFPLLWSNRAEQPCAQVS